MEQAENVVYAYSTNGDVSTKTIADVNSDSIASCAQRWCLLSSYRWHFLMPTENILFWQIGAFSPLGEN